MSHYRNGKAGICLRKKRSKLLSKNARTRILGIANPAGATGKSVVSGFLSIALARFYKKKVLCISAVPNDHALLALGIDVKSQKGILDFGKNDLVGVSTIKSPYESNVDAISYSTLENIAINQESTFGKSDLSSVLKALINKNQYDFIICDCGNGQNSEITLQMLLCASDIIIPIGDNVSSTGGLKKICTQVHKAGYKGEIHYLHSIGFLTNSQKSNILIREKLMDVKKNLLAKSIKINELRTVIPRRISINVSLWKHQNLFFSKKGKDIVKAYENLADEFVTI